MQRRSTSLRRGVVGSIALAVALSVSALAATGSNAAVTSQKKNGKVDKAAVLRFGDRINESGGVSFDPSNSTLTPVAAIYYELLYDTLIIKDPDGKLTPGLATEWKTPDQQTIELTLRDGVKFTDGTPFNAAAVKAAIDRHLQVVRSSATGAGSQTPTPIKSITSVDAPNDKTVVLHLDQPIAKVIINEHLTSARYLAIPSPTAVASGNLREKPVGAGPYMLESWSPGQDIVLKRNPNYWNPKSQKLAGYRFTQVTPGPPAISALQAGSVDLIWNYAVDAVPTIEGQNGLKAIVRPGVRVNDLGLCVSKGVFQNKTARQALQYAVNRKEINEAVLQGQGEVSQVALPPSHPNYNPELQGTYSYNVNKAKQMLQQAGVAPGTTVSVMTSNFAPQPQMADVVSAQLKAVGLNPEVTISANLPADAARVLPDILLVGIDPSLFANAFQGVSALNQCNWRNPQVDAAFAVINNGDSSKAEVQKAWDDFQKVVLEESPVVYTAVGPLLAASTDKVRGAETIIWPSGPDLRYAYMVK